VWIAVSSRDRDWTTGWRRACSDGGSGRARLEGERAVLCRDDGLLTEVTGEVVPVVELCETCEVCDACDVCDACEGAFLCLGSADKCGCVGSVGDWALEDWEVVESFLRCAG